MGARDDGRELVLLRILAILFALRALTNLGKPLGTGTGLVFLGTLVTGTPMIVLSLLVGAFMIVFAFGLWNARRFAVPMGLLYVAYVLVNVVRFPMVHGLPADLPAPAPVVAAGYAVYGAVAVGLPALATWLAARRSAPTGLAASPAH